uniref:Uncharacterized protein n=1 Tax=Panagrolaimus sp. PS1159 TaxID=55785 RepID=A0AC35GDE8_9BILA
MVFSAFNVESSDITADTVKNLIKLKKMNDFKCFCLYNIPECFNFKSFTDFMNKNKQIYFRLLFRQLLSNYYKLQIEAYKDEIKKEKFEGVDPPKIEVSEFL